MYIKKIVTVFITIFVTACMSPMHIYEGDQLSEDKLAKIDRVLGDSKYSRKFIIAGKTIEPINTMQWFYLETIQLR